MIDEDPQYLSTLKTNILNRARIGNRYIKRLINISSLNW